MCRYAPIVLFVYNRPSHTRRTLEALEKADLADQSALIVYADGASDATKEHEVNQVRAIIKESWAFQSVTIIEREKNWGLAANVIDGVTAVVQQHGRVIVLEDDLEISPVGLRYFNAALERLAEYERVMSISGYMYPVKRGKELPETFFFRVVNSWGWATWDRAWKHFNPDIHQLTENFSPDDIRRFSVDNTENFWKQIREFKRGLINSWAIRWYLSVFKQGGLTLYPRQSMIRNLGTDGSGTHSDKDTAYDVELADSFFHNFPDDIQEHPEAYSAIKHFFKHRKGNILKRMIRYARKYWNK